MDSNRKKNYDEFIDGLARFVKNFSAYVAQTFPRPAYDKHPRELPMNTDSSREILYAVAKASIGRDASPKDNAPDDLACAESLSNIIQKALPEIRFPTLLSTIGIFEYLERSTSFTPTTEPKYGDIIISVTGSGNGKVAHGHCGVIGKVWIMSNDSRTGTWEAAWQLESWKRYYSGRGGMETLFYRLT